MPLPELPPFLTRWPDGQVVVTGTRVLPFYVVDPDLCRDQCVWIRQ